MDVILTIDKVHTVPQRALDCGPSLGELNQVYGPNHPIPLQVIAILSMTYIYSILCVTYDVIWEIPQILYFIHPVMKCVYRLFSHTSTDSFAPCDVIVIGLPTIMHPMMLLSISLPTAMYPVMSSCIGLLTTMHHVMSLCISLPSVMHPMMFLCVRQKLTNICPAAHRQIDKK